VLAMAKATCYRTFDAQSSETLVSEQALVLPLEYDPMRLKLVMRLSSFGRFVC